MSVNQNYEILFCGPIALPGEPARGGYQACNRRTIEALRKSGLTVIHLPYPEPQGGALAKLYAYATGFAKLTWKLIRLAGRRRIFHLTGLYKYFISVEWLFVTIAKWFGCHVIYDLRAGSAIRYFENGTWIYRKLFALVLRQSDCVMVEGEIYLEFVEKLTGKRPHYLPNHVDEKFFSPVRQTGFETGLPTLIYLGRVVPEKGVGIVLDAARELGKNGLDCQVVIAGSGDSGYVADLVEHYRDCRVHFTGPIGPSEVAAEFSASHFFLFPSAHLGEGHSNALTEAMAAGCVPIASANGFNPSVIGECGRIVTDTMDAALYADAIAKIWAAGSWSMLSNCCISRVSVYFSTSRVVDDLMRHYVTLVGKP